MGRLTKNLATWKLERGISLGHLEQLLGSSSVFGAFSTQVLMGSFNALAIGLFILWALSPLGGQSSLHIIRTLPSVAVTPKDIFTFNTEIASPFESIRLPLSWLGPQLNGLYVTSLMAPPDVKRSPVDTWGNLKVPLMSQLAPNHTANETGWYNFGFTDDIPYSSLIGIPVGGLPHIGNITFNVESSYFDFNCYSLSLSPYVPIMHTFSAPTRPSASTRAGTHGSLTESKEPPTLLRIPNNTFYGKIGPDTSFSFGMDSYIDWNSGFLAKLRAEGMSAFINNVTNNDRTFFSQQQTFLFESKYFTSFPGMKNPATVAYCNAKRIYVESAVECIEDPFSLRKPQCSIIAVRDSQRRHQPADITPFLFPTVLDMFSAALSQDQGQAGTYSLTEKYINNTDTPLLVQDVDMRLFELDKKVFSQRLTQVINTFYFGSLFPSAIVGGLDTTLPMYTVSTYTDEPVNRTTTGMVTTRTADLYNTDIQWLTVFLATGVAMFAAAAVSSTLAHFTTIPDVLGYASSLTRHSLYFAHSTEGSALDGLSRSRRMKNKKVRLGDVQSGEKIGLLAFSEVDTAARPEKKRLYQ